MPFSKESVEYFTLRNNQLASLKHQTKIGIFGSFSKSRKAGLLALKKFLCDNGYNARTSEDLDKRSLPERLKRNPVCDRKISEKLIRESDIHIFILAKEQEGEPSNLIQSVSMEIEQLHTLSVCGQQSDNYVVIFAETGLIGTMGGVCEGLLLSKRRDWPVGEFTDITEIFLPARQFCMNCILDMYSF